jgi:predicted CXXCH cytochrome family protein
MLTRKWKKVIWVVCTVGVLCGCDPLTVHKVTSTIFDGVPTMPPPEQFCRDYHEKKLQEERDELMSKGESAAKAIASDHPPYAEKKCDSCHDKAKESGLIVPKDQLCFVCHPNIIKKAMVHGPASVGGCLECHDPHTSQFPSLLKVEKRTLCASCHKEKRMAEGMHNKVTAKGMLCTDCHDPHSGDAQYFLR